KVGRDWPVGVRFLAEECIKDGYTVEEAKLIALRMAQLGIDYISLSVGGKFEDAIHREGQPLYPYTGYSGDRCMPGDWYPPLPHASLAATIKAFIESKGFDVPVASVGKISDPADAERLLAEGKADIIGMARQLLADPFWPKKVREGRADEVVRCIYCNVCKQLDENFKEVHCFLWPKDARQAPLDDRGAERPRWGEDRGGLVATLEEGKMKLLWSKPVSGRISGYDIYRADDGGEVRCLEAVKGTRYVDRTVLGGLRYSYYVRAYDASGHASAPSNSVTVEPGVPDFDEIAASKDSEALHA
ncbi:MAG TPA: NADH:flavin oxidoreductase, partial [Alphaproteobacteria bacterium]